MPSNMFNCIFPGVQLILVLHIKPIFRIGDTFLKVVTYKR